MLFGKSVPYFIKLPYAAVLILVSNLFTSTNVFAALQSNSSTSYQYKQVQPSKVKVGTASEFDEVTELGTQVNTFAELHTYLNDQAYDSISDAITVTESFLARVMTKEMTASSSQIVDVHLMLAGLFSDNHQLKESKSLLIKVAQMKVSEPQTILLKTIESRNHQAQQNWFLAAQGYLTVFDLAEQISDLTTQVSVATNLAEIYHHILDNQQAKRWLTKATQLAQSSDNLALLLEVSTVAASQFQTMNELKAAESVLLAVIAKAKQLKLVSVEISLSKQLSDVYLQANELDKAREQLEQSYLLASKFRNVPQQYALLTNLIALALAEGDTNEATKILTEADKLTKYVSDMSLVIEFNAVKAQVYAGKRQYVEALQLLDEINTLSLASSSGHPNLTQQNTVIPKSEQLRALKQRAQWQALLGRSRSAISNFEKLHKTDQQNLNDKAQQRIRFIQQSYLADRQRADQEIALSQQQLQNVMAEKQQLDFELTRNFIIYVLLFLAALVYWLYYNKKHQAERVQLMNLDLISGAKNHNYLSRRFRQYVQHDVKFSLVMFDIDNMTRVNEAVGHDNADIIFRQIVQRLAVRLSTEKELVRLAGDKFMVIVENFNQKQAFLLAEILRKELNNQSFVINSQTFDITASFSAIEYHQGETLESLKQALNLSVQIAKQAGGDKTTQLRDD